MNNILECIGWSVTNIIAPIIILCVGYCINRKLKKFKSVLKRHEIIFSTYNQMQIKVLGNMYHLLLDFKRATNDISHSEKSSPEHYGKVHKVWIGACLMCKETFSKEKYLIPQKLKDKYSAALKDFNTLEAMIDVQSKLKNLFYTDEQGNEELGGNDDDLALLNRELEKYNRAEVFKKSMEEIGYLRKDIEDHFNGIEKLLNAE